MRKAAWAWGVVAVLTVGTMPASAMPSPLGTLGEDDLAVVRRAVAALTQATEPTPRPRALDAPGPTEARKKSEPPQWLRVRVIEKGSKKVRVSVNLPLSLVRALGDDLPLDFQCSDRHRDDGESQLEPKGEKHRKGCTIKIGDILQALDTGQNLVEVDDDEATIRVWVE